MQSFKDKLLATFDTYSKGYSARKLTAFVIIFGDVVAHLVWIKHCYEKQDFSLMSEVLIIDYGFVATLLGMTTYQAVKQNTNETTTTTNNPA